MTKLDSLNRGIAKAMVAKKAEPTVNFAAEFEKRGLKIFDNQK